MHATRRLRLYLAIAVVGVLGALVITSYRLRLAPTLNGSHIVVIDPGHGGKDPGAVGSPGIYEKNINLSIAMILATLLRQKNITVYMTRTSDQVPSSPPFHTVTDLRHRAFMARRWHATLFITIHTNAEPSHQAQGPIVYYQAGSKVSWELANHVSQALAAIQGRMTAPRPIRQLVLQESGVPAINVEVGFLTHPLDQSRLLNSHYQTQIAQAVTQGIVRYLYRG